MRMQTDVRVLVIRTTKIRLSFVMRAVIAVHPDVSRMKAGSAYNQKSQVMRQEIILNSRLQKLARHPEFNSLLRTSVSMSKTCRPKMLYNTEFCLRTTDTKRQAMSKCKDDSRPVQTSNKTRHYEAISKGAIIHHKVKSVVLETRVAF